jgi:integrase/recombinase XerD
MLDAMAVHNFSDKTRHDYIRQVTSFASFLGRSPDTAGADDLRRFQLHQRQHGVQPASMNSAVSALRFFFSVTLDRPDMERHLTFVREPRKIPVILSLQEISRLLQAAPGPKDALQRSTASQFRAQL